MVDTVYWLPVYAGLGLKPVGLVHRLVATWRRFCIHRVNRVNSQWLCHDDSTINIVIGIIIFFWVYVSMFICLFMCLVSLVCLSVCL